MNRRTALKTLATGASLPFLTARALADSPPAAPTAALPAPAFTLGVATVTLKSLPLDNMLAAVKRVGFDVISLHRAHSPWENQPGQWRETAAKIRAAGITPHCCGVIALKNDETAMRRMMDYVKILGVPLFSCSPEPAALPLLEKLVKEYDLRAAIHNHGPEDKSWPGALTVLKALGTVDPRIGLCLDVGHSYRAGEDPVAIIRQHAGRIYDVHIKDSVAQVGQDDVPIEMGRGKLDLAAMLRALAEARYTGGVWLEYEKDPNDPVPGLAESAGYLRGLLRVLDGC
jgi:sugar phosphate isomerase/epimerase